MKLLKHTISVEGLEAALEFGRQLLAQGYGVMIYKEEEFDDATVYIVAFEYYELRDDDYERFAAITGKEVELIEAMRQRQQYKELEQIYGKKQK